MNFRLRDYQQLAREAIHEEFKTVTSTLVVLPTGAGKTCLFSIICQDIQPRRAMVIAHREELIWQARNKIYEFTGLESGIEMADNFVNGSLFGEMPVVVSTIQTQNSAFGDRRRMSRFNPEEFGILIIDECHHATADSYRTLIAYYKTKNPKIKILGVTATPDRKDEEALGQIFDTVAFDYEILDAIEDGWLCPVEQQFVAIEGLDFSEVRTTAGDLNGSDLQGVASAAVQILGSRRGIVFTATVKQAEQISNILNRHRQGMASWVCGETNKDTRRDILAQFKGGTIQVVCNCGVLTEGFDDAGVEVIVMARPTKSRALYAQMAGRSTRPLAGTVDHLDTKEERREAIKSSAKPSCLLVDFVGNSGRHRLMTGADILGGKVSETIIDMAIKAAKEKGIAVNITEEMKAAEEKLRKEAEDRRLAEEARKARLVAKVKFSSKQINPFDLFGITPVKERGWDAGKTLTEKQKGVLLRAGVNPDSMPYAQSKQVLNEMFRRMKEHLATAKQTVILRKYGYTDPKITFDQASNLLNRLAANGWRRPVTP